MISSLWQQFGRRPSHEWRVHKLMTTKLFRLHLASSMHHVLWQQNSLTFIPIGVKGGQHQLLPYEVSVLCPTIQRRQTAFAFVVFILYVKCCSHCKHFTPCLHLSPKNSSFPLCNLWSHFLSVKPYQMTSFLSFCTGLPQGPALMNCMKCGLQAEVCVCKNRGLISLDINSPCMFTCPF